MSQDSVRVFLDHLLRLRPAGGAKLAAIDVFVVSNGGDGTVAWQLITYLREFAEKISVLVPYRAYSAATLLALGADEIVMGPFGQLGPVDPKVQNEFNPDAGNGQKLSISVEDVKSYIHFIKTTVGISHEDELIKAVTALTDKVHPLALGNVERFLAQSRLIATKLLRTHMSEEQTHLIKDTVETLVSKFYFHGHPIGREEAVTDLRLNVTKADVEVEELMWKLFKEYERLGDMGAIFNPAVDIARARIGAEGPHRQQYVEMVEQAMGQGANRFQAHQMAETVLNQQHDPVLVEQEIPYVFIDSGALSSRFVVRSRFELLPEQVPGQAQIRQEAIDQGWITRKLTPRKAAAPKGSAKPASPRDAKG